MGQRLGRLGSFPRCKKGPAGWLRGFIGGQLAPQARNPVFAGLVPAGSKGSPARPRGGEEGKGEGDVVDWVPLVSDTRSGVGLSVGKRARPCGPRSAAGPREGRKAEGAAWAIGPRCWPSGSGRWKRRGPAWLGPEAGRAGGEWSGPSGQNREGVVFPFFLKKYFLSSHFQIHLKYV